MNFYLEIISGAIALIGIGVAAYVRHKKTKRAKQVRDNPVSEFISGFNPDGVSKHSDPRDNGVRADDTTDTNQRNRDK